MSRITFDQVLADYLLKLSPKKRDKALMNQSRYNTIVSILNDPYNSKLGDSPQFRFWAKKMFRLASDDDDILTHSGKPVVVRERLFEVLASCHVRAKHGGRDQTCKQLRGLYSW